MLGTDDQRAATDRHSLQRELLEHACRHHAFRPRAGHEPGRPGAFAAAGCKDDGWGAHALAARWAGHLERFFHLGGGISKHVRVATGGRAVQVARVREQTGRAPKQLDAGAILLLLQHLDDCIKVLVGFAQVFAFGRDIAVVKGVKRGAQFFDEFKRHACPVLRVLH